MIRVFSIKCGFLQSNEMSEEGRMRPALDLQWNFFTFVLLTRLFSFISPTAYAQTPIKFNVYFCREVERCVIWYWGGYKRLDGF